MGGMPAFCINNANSDLDASPIFEIFQRLVFPLQVLLQFLHHLADMRIYISLMVHWCHCNDNDGAFADRTGDNIDHICMMIDGGSGGTWNFCSDTTYRSTGNSLGQFGTLKVGGSGTLRDNTGGFGSIEITGGNTGNMVDIQSKVEQSLCVVAQLLNSVCMMMAITIGQLDILQMVQQNYFLIGTQ